jgi:hypothetical protein
MLTFPTIDPDAQRVLTFDCSKDLGANEVLSGGAVLKNIICTAGIDLNPRGMVLGAVSYDKTGTQILVPVGNLTMRNGNDYVMEVTSFTSVPPKEVVVRALLQVRAD